MEKQTDVRHAPNGPDLKRSTKQVWFRKMAAKTEQEHEAAQEKQRSILTVLIWTGLLCAMILVIAFTLL